MCWCADLARFLGVLAVVLLEVAMGTNDIFELVGDHHTWALEKAAGNKYTTHTAQIIIRSN